LFALANAKNVVIRFRHNNVYLHLGADSVGGIVAVTVACCGRCIVALVRTLLADFVASVRVPAMRLGPLRVSLRRCRVFSGLATLAAQLLDSWFVCVCVRVGNKRNKTNNETKIVHPVKGMLKYDLFIVFV
jgi:hypothetical protein